MRARRTAVPLTAVLLSAVGSVGPTLGAQPRLLATSFIRRDTNRSTDSGASRSPWTFEQCLGGLTYGAPLKWALSYGMGYLHEGYDTDTCVHGVARVGLGGAGLYAGVAKSGMFGGRYAATVGLLRTFKDPLNALVRRTYVGGSVLLWQILICPRRRSDTWDVAPPRRRKPGRTPAHRGGSRWRGLAHNGDRRRTRLRVDVGVSRGLFRLLHERLTKR